MPLPLWGLIVGVVIGFMASPNPLLAVICGGMLALITWAIQGFPISSGTDSISKDSGIGDSKEQIDTTDPDTQFKLGQAFRLGAGVEKDEAEAFKWIEKSANAGHTEAQNMLGFMYNNGEGVEKNEGEAYRWYVQAAEKGDVKSQTNLGYLLSEDYSDIQNYEEAAKWLTKAADQGEGMAQEQLASLYYWGKGVEKDFGKAFGLYVQASMRGSMEADRMIEVMRAKGQI
jgi:uncharacterized protein